MGLFGYSAYAASKYAMTGYADCLRMDVLKYNIGVSVCFPPDTDTPQHHEEMKGMPAETASVAGNISCMQPEDVARDFLYGMSTGKYHIIPSLNNKITMWAIRHLPGISRFFIDRDIKSASAKAAPAPATEDDKAGFLNCPQRAKEAEAEPEPKAEVSKPVEEAKPVEESKPAEEEAKPAEEVQA